MLWSCCKISVCVDNDDDGSGKEGGCGIGAWLECRAELTFSYCVIMDAVEVSPINEEHFSFRVVSKFDNFRSSYKKDRHSLL